MKCYWYMICDHKELCVSCFGTFYIKKSNEKNWKTWKTRLPPTSPKLEETSYDALCKCIINQFINASNEDGVVFKRQELGLQNSRYHMRSWSTSHLSFARKSRLFHCVAAHTCVKKKCFGLVAVARTST